MSGLIRHGYVPLISQVIFRGYSDDTFGVYWNGSDGLDLDNCADGSPITIGVRLSGDKADRFRVTGQFEDEGPTTGWSIRVAPVENADVEGFRMWLRQLNGQLHLHLWWIAADPAEVVFSLVEEGQPSAPLDENSTQDFRTVQIQPTKFTSDV